MNEQGTQRILLGAGGHAKVLLALCRALGHAVDGICDPDLHDQRAPLWEGIPVVGDDSYLNTLTPSCTELINGLGHTIGSSKRAELFISFRKQGFLFPKAVHPFAWVAPNTQLGNGVQVMAGSVIQTDSSVAANTIINSHASVDHDCVIEEHCHIAPGVILCGGVTVQQGVFIGAGATILPGVTVGSHSVVGAGATLYEDLPPAHKAVGSKIQMQKLEKGVQ